MDFTPKWNEVQPQNKWKIVRRQRRFALWALYTSVGSMMLGFDYGIQGTATAYPAFQEQFGIPWKSEPSGYLVPARWQSAWSGATSAGGIIGALCSGVLLDKIGRKHTLAVGAATAAIGVGMQIASTEWKLFLGGRIVNAAGFDSVFTACPVWIGENVRPELRGFFLCLTNCSIVVGQFILACVAQGTSKIKGKWSYELLIVLQMVPVAVILFIYPFFPESAYYQLQRGNDGRARKSLNRIHGSRDQELIEAEMVRISTAVELSEELKQSAKNRGPLIFQCFQGTNLKRTLIAMLPVAGQQFIGAAFVLGYVTYFLSLLKVRDYFTVSLILFVVMLLSNLSAFIFSESLGRRTVLVPGIIALTVTLFVMGVMGCIKAAGAIWVILICIFLWAIIYQLSIGACGFVLAAEVSSLPLRSAAQSVLSVTQLTVGWLISFISPYLINPDAGNLGAKVGFVFAGFGVPICILFYLFIPETKGLSFAELDYLFGQEINPRRFQSAIHDRRAELANSPDVEVLKQVGKGETVVETGILTC